MEYISYSRKPGINWCVAPPIDGIWVTEVLHIYTQRTLAGWQNGKRQREAYQVQVSHLEILVAPFPDEGIWEPWTLPSPVATPW